MPVIVQNAVFVFRLPPLPPGWYLVRRMVASGKTRGIKTKDDKIKRHHTQIERLQQYSKLVYVAMSRAKGIVGYGISKSQFERYFNNDQLIQEWDIVFTE